MRNVKLFEWKDLPKEKKVSFASELRKETIESWHKMGLPEPTEEDHKWILDSAIKGCLFYEDHMVYYSVRFNRIY